MMKLNSDELLKKLSKYQERWIKIAYKFSSDKNYVEDLVQESYIKIWERNERSQIEFVNEKTVLSYMYLTIRSVCNDFNSINNRVQKLDVEDYKKKFEFEDTLPQAEAKEEMFRKIEDRIESWNWYDRELFKLYKDTPMSLRGLAKEIGISWVSIHHTIKRRKEELRKEFGLDYTNYKTEDND